MAKNPKPELYVQASQILVGARDLVSRAGVVEPPLATGMGELLIR